MSFYNTQGNSNSQANECQLENNDSSTNAAASNVAVREPRVITKKFENLQNVNERTFTINAESRFFVTEHANYIYNYLLVMESKFPITKSFLQGHKCTPNARAILVNCMVEIHQQLKSSETLHLAVSILDSYLQVTKEVCHKDLLLVGTVAVWIAAKYEDMKPIPPLNNFMSYSSGIYSKEQFISTEADILEKLKFNLGRPSSLIFFKSYCKIIKTRAECGVLGEYLLELALMDYVLCQIMPSLQAIAAWCLAISILDNLQSPSDVWSSLTDHINTMYSDVEPVIIRFAQMLNYAEVSRYQSIRHKYASGCYFSISLHPKLQGPLVRQLAYSE